jgi:hypothetical protein
MVKQADSGLLSIAAAVAAAIAGAVARSILSRRRRVPIQVEEHSMCRNHSHMTGVLLEAVSDQDHVMATMLVVQPLTLELLSGEKLMVPHYSVCLVLRDDPTQLLGRRLHVMAEQENLQLHKEGDLFSFGHITQEK